MQYVLGFHFNEDLEQVALIRKIKPEFMKDKLNGIGGKIEPGESPMAAMIREFQEEASAVTSPFFWRPVCKLHGHDFENWSIHVFAGYGELTKLKTTSAEPVVICSVHHIDSDRSSMPNIKWLVPLAKAALLDPIDYRPLDIQQ